MRFTRSKARAHGAQTYTVGRPCKVPHLPIRRYVSSGQCIECAKQISRDRHGIPRATRLRPARCECCGRKPGARALAVDHSRVTGKFRGWLCFRCNTALGLLGDSLRGARRAVRYLERTR